MKRFAVLGLGNFGSHLARSLGQAGVDVLAVDMDEDAVFFGGIMPACSGLGVMDFMVGSAAAVEPESDYDSY